VTLSDINLKALQIRNIGGWPLLPKKLVLGLCSLLVFSFGYWIDLSDALQKLDDSNKQVVTLGGLYIDTHRQISNLSAYREEVNKIKEELNKLTALLPSHSEASELLGDISQRATYSGVQFVAIKPGNAVSLDFYQESSTQFSVSGSYNSLGGFVSSVSTMPRLVTLHDFSIKVGKTSANLTMDVLAKSYWLNAVEKRK
jgi:type IV pilus assembly protein PilO